MRLLFPAAAAAAAAAAAGAGASDAWSTASTTLSELIDGAILQLQQRASAMATAVAGGGGGGAVTELTDATYKEFIASHNNTLLLFYAPWCHWCVELLPRFAAAAGVLQEQTAVAAAQVDATRWPVAADAFRVRSFPTVFLVLDGVPHEYAGGRRAADIVAWTTRRLETEVRLATRQQLDDFLALHEAHSVLVARFDPADPAHEPVRRAFVAESRKLENVGFAEVESLEVVNHLAEDLKRISKSVSALLAPESAGGGGGPGSSAPPTIILLNPHHRQTPGEVPSALYTGRPLSSEGGAADFERFVRTYRFPLVSTFTFANGPDLFADGRPIFVLLEGGAAAPAGAVASRAATLARLAAAFRDSLLFVHSRNGSPADRRLAALLGAEEELAADAGGGAAGGAADGGGGAASDASGAASGAASASAGSFTIRLFKPATDRGDWFSTRKYRPESAGAIARFDYDELHGFISEYLSGKLAPYLKSEPVPDPEDFEDSLVRPLVARQFAALVEDAPHDVLVVFHAPWCGHCRKLDPVLHAAAEALKAPGSPAADVEIMKMDATKNEVHLFLVGYPTIMLYSGPPGARKPVQYNGERTVEDLVQWMAAHSAEPFSADHVLKNAAAAAGAGDGGAFRPNAFALEEL